jgi:hypothetical protein
MHPLPVLSAVDPAWKTKSVQQWDEEDTKHVLDGSPSVQTRGRL